MSARQIQGNADNKCKTTLSSVRLVTVALSRACQYVKQACPHGVRTMRDDEAGQVTARCVHQWKFLKCLESAELVPNSQLLASIGTCCNGSEQYSETEKSDKLWPAIWGQKTDI